jgi:hypothetical protein
VQQVSAVTISKLQGDMTPKKKKRKEKKERKKKKAPWPEYPFQAHYFSENLVARESNPEHLNL